jgi:hypothetical protein
MENIQKHNRLNGHNLQNRPKPNAEKVKNDLTDIQKDLSNDTPANQSKTDKSSDAVLKSDYEEEETDKEDLNENYGYNLPEYKDGFEEDWYHKKSDEEEDEDDGEHEGRG